MSTRLARRSVTRTAAYTLAQTKGDFSGTAIDTIGAIGSLTFTLPPAKVAIKGWWYEFHVGADQSLIVAAANAGEIVAGTSLTNDNVGFQITNRKLGGRILVVCTGTKWLATGVRAGGGFCVGGVEVANAEGGSFVFGAGTGTFKPEGLLDSQFSVAGVGNAADATDDVLFTYPLPANSLNANGKKLRIRMGGVTAANGQNKRIKVFLGATAVVDSGVITSNAKNWTAEVVITRTGVGAQLAFGRFTVDGVADVLTKSTPAADETTGLTVKGTGSSPTSSSASDVLGHDWLVEGLAF